MTRSVWLGTLAAASLVASVALTATAATVASATTLGLPQSSASTTTSAAPTTSTTSINASASRAASDASAIPAGMDINHASEADLDSLVGVGPALTARILAQRAVAPFADWADLMKRVKGIRQATAHRLAEQGVTVNGQRP